MKRNTLFLLSYSIIIPLVSSAPSYPVKEENLNELSFEHYETRCVKYSKKNFTNVQDYIKKCNDTGKPVETITDVISHTCFGVVNNILVACDKSAVEVLQFLNDTLNKKSDSSKADPSICPLKPVEVEDFLKISQKFSNLTDSVKIEVSCKLVCFDIKSEILENRHCELWHKTNMLIKNVTEEEKKLKQPTHVANSQVTEEKGVTVDSSLPASNSNNMNSPDKNAPLSLKVGKSNVGTKTEKQGDLAETTGNKPETQHSNNNESPNNGEKKESEPLKTKPIKTAEKLSEAHSTQNKAGKTQVSNVEPPSNMNQGSNEKGNDQMNKEILEDPASQNNNKDNTEAENPENPALNPDQESNIQPIGDFDENSQFGDNAPPGNEEKTKNILDTQENPDVNVMNEESDDANSLNAQVEDPPEKKKNPDPEIAASKSVASNYVPPYTSTETEEESHFYVYFFTSASIVIMGYVAFHNKNKILAYALEGRRNRNGRRRPNSASYRKLDCSLEEAITSNSSHASVTNVVY